MNGVDFTQCPERSRSGARPRVPLSRKPSISGVRPRIPLMRQPILSPRFIASLATAFLLSIAVAFLSPGTIQANNNNPEFTEDTATRSIAENSAANANVGAPVTTTDSDGDTLTYSLSGTDSDDFTIDSATGQITADESLNYEEEDEYSVTVGVSDGKDSSGTADTVIDDTIDITISVTDVNEPPSFTDGATGKRNLPENSAADSKVGKPVAATDPEGDTLSYSIRNTNINQRFHVNSATGQLTVAWNTPRDYENGQPTYDVTISVSDGSSTDSITVTVTITDVNEPPPKMSPTVTAATNTATPTTKMDVSWTALTNTQTSGKPAVDGLRRAVPPRPAIRRGRIAQLSPERDHQHRR